MSERRRSIGRVIALQSKLADLAAARLAQAEARKAAAVAARDDLNAFVKTAELTGALATLAIARMRSLAAAEAEAEARRKPLAASRQAAETRLKLAERVGEDVAREEAEAAERKALERLIEEAVAREGVERA